MGINGTPNVNIVNTPTVNLAQGTTVGITGGNFNFSNTPATPLFNRDVQNPAAQPFQFELCSDFGDLNGSCLNGHIGPDHRTIPDNAYGKPVLRMVIESVSGNCTASNGPVKRVALQTSAGGVVDHIFAPGQLSAGEQPLPLQVTRIYSDPGTDVFFSAAHGLGNTGFVCTVDISGYIVSQ